MKTNKQATVVQAAKVVKTVKPVKAIKPTAARDADDGEEDGDEDEEEAAAGHDVVPQKYREKYGKLGNCGDAYAEAFAKVKGMDELAKVAAENGVDINRWAGRNHGMVRMNLGNVLRGMRTKQDVRIAGVVFKHQPKPVVEKAVKAPAKKVA